MSPIIRINTHNTMGKWTQFFEVPSESNPNQAYIVSADGDFTNMGCSCPAWTHHMPRTNCKHITRLVQERGTMGNAVFITSDRHATIAPADKLQRTLSRFANIDIT